MSAKSFFTPEQTRQLVDAVAAAELNTSGEIRIHIEKHCEGDVLEKAFKVFGKLKMHETKDRNGVLFYLAVSDHKFAVAGDEGINKKVPADFWDAIKLEMEKDFKAGDFTNGLCKAIDSAGKQLKHHFPRADDDKNELNNDVSFD